LLDEDAAPPGPLEAAAPPPVPPVEEAAPPLPAPAVAPAPVSLLEELAEPEGAAGALEDEEDDPPGTMIVSFSFVVVVDVADPLGAALLPPGTTVVVSLRSQAERARAPIRTNR
jgi:hypothetical protein